MTTVLRNTRVWARLFRRWILVSGRDALETTRGNLLSVEARAGAAVFVVLFFLGCWQAGSWVVRGPMLGGETLAGAMSWCWMERWGWGALRFLLHAGVGILQGVLVRNAWRGVGRVWPNVHPDRYRRWILAGTTGGAVFLLHGLILLRSLGRTPAIFQETFLNRGEWVFAFWRLAMGSRLQIGWVTLGFIVLLVVPATFEMAKRCTDWFMKFTRPKRMALVVLGGTVFFFGLGLEGVRRTQQEKNVGPNILFVSVDGLRSDYYLNPRLSPRLSSWARQGKTWSRCVPVSTGLTPTLACALTGLRPLVSNVRNDFPAEEDLRSVVETLPGILRQKGFHTEVLADGPNGYFSREKKYFDGARVAGVSLPVCLARREMERSPHLLPYVSGFWGRRLLSVLRGSPFLTDPDLLVREAKSRLKSFRHTKRFFLWVHFSALAEPVLVSSPQKGFTPPLWEFHQSPQDDLSRVDWSDRVARYQIQWKALDKALGDLFHSLRSLGLADTTTVVLWSPRATPLSFTENRVLSQLEGGPLFMAPLTVFDPRRSSPSLDEKAIPSVDVPVVLLDQAGGSVPERWEGEVHRDGRPVLVSVEKSLSSLDHFIEPLPPHPPLLSLLIEDRDAPGHWRLDPRWEDPVRLNTARMIQIGDERMILRPGRGGGSFFHYQYTGDVLSTPLKRSQEKRTLDMEELFFRDQAREPGWHPENARWVPDAFLK